MPTPPECCTQQQQQHCTPEQLLVDNGIHWSVFGLEQFFLEGTNPEYGGAHRARRAGVMGLKGPTRMKMAVYSTCLVRLIGYPPYSADAERIFCTGLPQFPGWTRVLG